MQKESQVNNDYRFYDSLFSFFCAIVLVGISYGHLNFLAKEGFLIISGIAWKLAFFLAILMCFVTVPFIRSFFLNLFRNFNIQTMLPNKYPKIVPSMFIFALAAVLFSHNMKSKWSYYSQHSQLISLSNILFYGAISSLFVIIISAYKFPKFNLSKFSCLLLLIAQALVCYTFYNYVKGRLIFGDDHPSFLYRLQTLYQQFPNIPFYSPEWNAGFEARDYFATGVISVFILVFPILKLWGDINSFDNAQVYTYLIPYLFVFLLPFSVYFAGRILEHSRLTSVISAILALCPSTTFFEWMLKYGTMGFAVSVSLTPIVFALCLRLSTDYETRWSDVFWGVLVSTLFLLWGIAFAVLIPITLYAIVCWKKTFSKPRRLKIWTFIILLIALNSLWICTWLNYHNAFSVLAGSSLPGSNIKSIVQARPELEYHKEKQVNYFAKIKLTKKLGREMLSQMNPLILIFAIPGIFLLNKRSLKIALSLTLVYLFVLALTGDFIKPQLELRRMAVFATFLMILPSAKTIDFILCNSANFFQNKLYFNTIGSGLVCFITLTLVLGCLIITPLNAMAIYQNASNHHYLFAPNSVKTFSEAINKFGGSGRTFFLGFVLHELASTSNQKIDGGHIAPLAKFSQKPLYSSHFIHARWSYVDPIPQNFLAQKEKGIEEFLDLINATSVATFRKDWFQHCSKLPEIYSLVYSDEKTWLFSRKTKNATYFLEGEGDINANLSNRIEITPHTTSAIIKFRWTPYLKISPSNSASISPHPVFTEELGGGKNQEVSFIKLSFDEIALKNKQRFIISYH